MERSIKAPPRSMGGCQIYKISALVIIIDSLHGNAEHSGAPYRSLWLLASQIKWDFYRQYAQSYCMGGHFFSVFPTYEQLLWFILIPRHKLQRERTLVWYACLRCGENIMNKWGAGELLLKTTCLKKPLRPTNSTLWYCTDYDWVYLVHDDMYVWMDMLLGLLSTLDLRGLLGTPVYRDHCWLVCEWWVSPNDL